MPKIVVYDPSDTVVAGRVTEYNKSANEPDYDSETNKIIDPDLDVVDGVPVQHWKEDTGAIVEMSQAEKDAWAVHLASMGELSPPQLTGDVDNYNPTGFNDSITVLKLTSNSDGNELRGLSGGFDGRELIVINAGTPGAGDKKFKIKSEVISSTAENRIVTPGDITMELNSIAVLKYFGSEKRYRIISINK